MSKKKPWDEKPASCAKWSSLGAKVLLACLVFCRVSSAATMSQAMDKALRGSAPAAAQALIDAGEDINAVDQRGASVLSRAIAQGGRTWTAFAIALLQRGADPRTSDQRGLTALHHAAFLGQVDLIDALLEKGAAIDAEVSDRDNLPRDWGTTALHWACAQGNYDAAAALLRKNASVDKADKLTGNTALHITALLARNGQGRLVELLLDFKAKIEALNGEKLTPLLTAADKANDEVVVTLLNHGADIHAVDFQGDNALVLAAVHGCGSEKTIAALAAAKIDPFQVGHQKKSLLELADLYGNGCEKPQLAITDYMVQTILSSTERKSYAEAAANPQWKSALFKDVPPLQWAIDRGYGELIEELVSLGAPLDEQEEGSKTTALILAAERGKLEVVKLLIERGADKELKDSEHRTALSAAVGKGRLEVAKYLLSKKCAVDVPSRFGDTALHAAAINSDLELVKALLKAGAKPASLGFEKKTPLHKAAEHSRLEVVRALAVRYTRQDLNHQTQRGDTALHVASSWGNIPAVAELLSRGANPYIRNGKGKTAMEEAGSLRADAREQLLALFAAYGKAAFAAIKQGDLAGLRRELKAGFHPDAQDDLGNTGLHYALYAGRLDLAEELIKAKAQIDVPNKLGETGLFFAILAEEAPVREKAVAWCLNHGAHADHENKDAKTALDLAQDLQDPAIIGLLKRSKIGK